MKYLKTNEEFIGGLIKGLGDKISVNFSKMFGSASKADKLMDQYKKEISSAHASKLATLKAYGEYIKIDQKDEDKENQLFKNIDAASQKFDEQIKLIKQKFDIKFSDIVDNEKNKKIQNYINLKKIEMQQELLSQEVKLMLTDSGMDEKDIQDPRAKELLKEINDKLKTSKRMKENQRIVLETEEQKELGFDIKKAKELSVQGKTYLWNGSPFSKYKFKDGDRIEFFSTSNKSETSAIIISDLGDKIRVKTENGNKVEINKKSVISSDNYEKENQKEENKGDNL